jgi:hypothetical protein
MVPARILTQPSLPRTVNGKLDRKRARQLPAPPAAPAPTNSRPANSCADSGQPDAGATDLGRPDGDRPDAGHPDLGRPDLARPGGPDRLRPDRDAERVLADICADLLGAGPVDPGDNFFELGGDSLLGIRLAVRAANAGIHFGPPDLLRCGTLRELATRPRPPSAPSATSTQPAPNGHPDAREGLAPNGADGDGAAGSAPADAGPPDCAPVGKSPAATGRVDGAAGGADTGHAGSGPAGAYGGGAAGAGPADHAPVSPPRRHVPLTPVMYGFLDGPSGELADFVDMHVLAVPAAIDPGHLPAAVARLVAVNEPLRYRFRRNELGWHIRCVDPPAAAAEVLDVRLLPPLHPAEEAAVLEQDAAALAGQLDLTRGPVLRLRYYRRGSGQDGLLLLVAHHFVFDSVSAVVLLDDLDAALAGLAAGRRPAAHQRRPAWRAWSEHLQDVARSDELAAELTYWTGILRAGAAAPRMPRAPAARDPAASAPAARGPGASGPGASGPGASGPGARDPGASGPGASGPGASGPGASGPGASGPGASGPAAGDPVYQEIPWPPRGLDGAAAEAAVGALAAAVARWQGRPEVCVMLEGAGTPNPYRPGGRPPAVGWFTSLHPALLPDDPARPGCPASAADRLRMVPNDGIGYGVLRHLTPMSPALAELRSLPEPDVLIAYQATAGSPIGAGTGLLRPRPELYPPPRRRVTGRFPLALRAAVGPGSLQVTILPAAGFDPTGVRALAGAIGQALAELAGAAVGPR